MLGDAAPGGVAFRDAIPHYLEHAKVKRQASTYRGYVHLLDVVNQARWTARKLDAISASDVTRWLDAIERNGKAAQRLNNQHSIVSGVFS